MKPTREYLTDACGAGPKSVIGPTSAIIAPTPIDRVENALSEAADLAQQTLSMVATIAGHIGPRDGRDDACDRPDGIIPALADRADDTVSIIRSAKAELTRLADLLGV